MSFKGLLNFVPSAKAEKQFHLHGSQDCCQTRILPALKPISPRWKLKTHVLALSAQLQSRIVETWQASHVKEHQVLPITKFLMPLLQGTNQTNPSVTGWSFSATAMHDTHSRLWVLTRMPLATRPPRYERLRNQVKGKTRNASCG